MLKKHNKLIMLLVLVTFMFTMVGSAGAVSFSDVTGNSVETSAIYKLNSLGIIDGYPDGTFGPEKTITRAEFAKIACVTAGLKSVASGMGATASPFTDVATDHWANGWINVAAAQGYVKGDPAGTFRPEDQITQAEVVTVLLRLLGYNDNLPGNWPSDYIAKAANLGVLDDVTFVANQAATRGIVAVMASATLDEDTVEYIASDNYFGSNGETLLEANFETTTEGEDVLVTRTYLDDDDYAMDVYDFDTNTISSIVLNKDVVVSGVATAFALDGRIVDYNVNDDDEATFIKVNPDVKAPVFGEIDYSAATDSVEIDDTDYDLDAEMFLAYAKQDAATFGPGSLYASTDVDLNADGDILDAGEFHLDPAYILANGLDANMDGDLLDAAAGDFVTDGKKVTLYFNEDGDVVYMAQVPKGSAVVVDEVKSDEIELKSGADIGDLDDDHDWLILNGLTMKPMALEDVKEGMLIYNLTRNGSNRGFDTLLAVVNIPVTGEMSRYYQSDNKVTIGETKYTLSGIMAGGVIVAGMYVEDNDGNSLNLKVGDLLGSEVTAKMDANQEIAYITGESSDSGNTRGVVVSNGKYTGKDETDRWVKIFTTDGTEAVYDIESDYWDDEYLDTNADTVVDDGEIFDVFGANFETATNEKGMLVEFDLNADGEINYIAKDADVQYPAAIGVNTLAVGDAEEDYDRLDVDDVIDGNYTWAYVKDSTVVIDLGYDGTDLDPELSNWADIEDAGATVKMDVYNDGSEIKYIVVWTNGGIADTGIKGVFSGLYADGSDKFAEIYVAGELKTYQYSGTSFAGAVEGDIVTFDADTDDVNNVLIEAGIAAAEFTNSTTINTVNDSDIETVAGNFIINADTLIIVMDGADIDKVGDIGDLDEGDTVDILEGTGDDTGIAKVILLE